MYESFWTVRRYEKHRELGPMDDERRAYDRQGHETTHNVEDPWIYFTARK